MPIYEFYCSKCHAVFSFLTRTVNTSKRPGCPRCGKPRLERKASAFAVTSGRPDPAGEDGLPGLDEGRMERAVTELAHDAVGLGDDDPRAMARLMRKLYDDTGMGMGEGMQETLRRIEAGEDPDRIEQDMGDVLEQEEPFVAGGGLRHRLEPPDVDDTLYEL